MEQVVHVFKLHPEQLKKIEKEVRADIIVTHQTTELQAGYMLGIQKVLTHIAKDWTNSTL